MNFEPLPRFFGKCRKVGVRKVNPNVYIGYEHPSTKHHPILAQLESLEKDIDRTLTIDEILEILGD